MKYYKAAKNIFNKGTIAMKRFNMLLIHQFHLGIKPREIFTNVHKYTYALCRNFNFLITFY